MEITYFGDTNSLYLLERNFLAASVRSAATEMELGSSRHSTADSGVIGSGLWPT